MTFTSILELSFLSSLPAIIFLVLAILIAVTLLIILYFSQKIKKNHFLLWIKIFAIIFLVVSFGFIVANLLSPPNAIINEHAMMLFNGYYL
ncbi:hypothetical protein QBE53_15985 [Vallitaleaceae bacterium 9-2]